MAVYRATTVEEAQDLDTKQEPRGKMGRRGGAVQPRPVPLSGGPTNWKIIIHLRPTGEF